MPYLKENVLQQWKNRFLVPDVRQEKSATLECCFRKRTSVSFFTSSARVAKLAGHDPQKVNLSARRGNPVSESLEHARRTDFA